MVSSIGYKLGQNRLITGFGTRTRTHHRRMPTRGSGVVRRVIGSLTRPALTYIANKIADTISGGAIRRRRHTVRHHVGGSYKYSGMGVRRPAIRRHHTVGRVGRPRSVLFGTGHLRRHRVAHRHHVLI